MKKHLLLCLLGFAIVSSQAQTKIKDGTIPATPSLPAAGSLLELESNSRGLRIPQIALTNTTTWLPLVGSGGAATSPGMTVYNTNAGIASSNTNYPALGIGEYYWDGTGWIVKNPVAAAAYIEPWYNVATNTGATGNTQNIYLMGNVGIGTTTPGYTFGGSTAKLDVLGGNVRVAIENTWTGFYPVVASANPLHDGLFLSYRSRGTLAAPTDLLDGDLMGRVEFRPFHGQGCHMQGIATENHTATATGSALRFSTVPNGTTIIAERMRIDDNGNVGIGFSSPTTRLAVNGGQAYFGISATPSVPAMANGTSTTDGILLQSQNGAASDGAVLIQRSGSAAFYGLYISRNSTLGSGSGGLANFSVNGSVTGSITTNGTTVTYNTTSDIRLKENIKVTHYGVADVMKIKVADYNYKTDKTKTITTGFLAQDLYKIYPDAVTPGGSDEKINPWQVDYGKITPLLVKAIQDQQAVIQKLEARLKALEEHK